MRAAMPITAAPKKMALEAVLFDLDGTLVDTAPDFVVAVNQLRNSHQLESLSAASISPHVSNGSIALTQHAFNITPEHTNFAMLRQALLDSYLECIGQHSALYNGLGTLLEQLNNAAIPWGIVTNKPIAYAQPLIEKLQLADSCKVLICPDHVVQVKPHPEGLFMAAKKMQCDASAIAYIGDHDRDIEAGRAAGMKTIAAAYGYISDEQNIQDWRADSIAKQPYDIHSTLERLFSCTI